MPTAEEKATFVAAREPMKKWFVENVQNGAEWLAAWEQAVAEAERIVQADRDRRIGRK